MNGNLELVYAKNNTKTQLIHSLGKAPLKVQRPFYPEGEKICHFSDRRSAIGDQCLYLKSEARK